MFDDMSAAERAVNGLEQAGFTRDAISVIRNQDSGSATSTSGSGGHSESMTTGESAAVGAGTGAALGAGAGLLAGLAGLFIPGIGTVLGVGPLAATIIGGAGIGAAAGGLSGALMASGVSEEDAALYTEGVRRGGTLVSVNAPDERADDAADILGNYGAVDIDERAASYTAAAPTVAAAPAVAVTHTEDTVVATDTSRSMAQPAAAMASGTQELRAGEAIPIVEEQIQVGKRQVQRGGVRVYAHVTERPVEEQVTLREEHVNVERRPVNRAATDADLASFKEGSIELTETAEEAVVAKRAFVKEEVVVGKEVEQHTETIRDTVRSTDVDVQRIQGSQQTGAVDFDTDFAEFRSDRRYAEAGWDKVEPEYRQRWESRNPGGTWDGVKNNARQAWERTKSGARNMVD
jgi:uncharacterized protein (TIGR02271 family)